MSVKPVLIDTNILMLQQEHDVLGQLRTEYPHMQLTVLEGTLHELERLTTQGSGADKQKARLAQHLISRQHLNMVPQSNNHVDDALCEYALHNQGIIVTQDKELQRRARAQRIPVLAIKRSGRLYAVP